VGLRGRRGLASVARWCAHFRASALKQHLHEHPDALVVDVRTPGEYAAGHVPGARNWPLGSRPPEEVAAELRADVFKKPIHVICQSGGRSRKFAESLARAGVNDVIDVEGGTSAWIAAGGALERDATTRAVWPLERQVRLGAGLLVLIGCALGTWAHPGWFGLAAFVGAGLVFAGATGWCGMALALAKMPWNR